MHCDSPCPSQWRAEPTLDTQFKQIAGAKRWVDTGNNIDKSARQGVRACDLPDLPGLSFIWPGHALTARHGMISWKLTRMPAGPQDQVIGLRDHDQFVMLST